VRRSHGSSRDGVDSILATNPGRLNVETGSKNVVALAIVGEVSTLIGERGSSNSDGILSARWGVVARVGIIVTSSNGKMDTGIDSGIDSTVEGWGLATAQAHVGSATLETFLALARLGGSNIGAVRLSGIFDTLNDVGHCA